VIAGGVIGGVVFLVSVVAAVILSMQRRRRRKQKKGLKLERPPNGLDENNSQSISDGEGDLGRQGDVVPELSSPVPELPTRDPVVYRAELAEHGGGLMEMQKFRRLVELPANEVARTV